MKLINILPVRNEDWVLGCSLRAMLDWADEVIILLHRCDDGTAEIVAAISGENPGRVHVLIDNDAVWHEMAQRQRLLEAARKLGATHIALLDADEILTVQTIPLIRRFAEQLLPAKFLAIKMFNCWRSLDSYRSDLHDFGSRAGTILLFREAPHLHWPESANRDYHQRSPIGSGMQHHLKDSIGGILHLQHANWRRLQAKHAWYKMMERLRFPEKPIHGIDAMYSQALEEHGLKFGTIPASWWPEHRKHLDLDVEPWQEAECRRLLKEYGDLKFNGLNLFGISS